MRSIRIWDTLPCSNCSASCQCCPCSQARMPAATLKRSGCRPGSWRQSEARSLKSCQAAWQLVQPLQRQLPVPGTAHKEALPLPFPCSFSFDLTSAPLFCEFGQVATLRQSCISVQRLLPLSSRSCKVGRTETGISFLLSALAAAAAKLRANCSQA